MAIQGPKQRTRRRALALLTALALVGPLGRIHATPGAEPAAQSSPAERAEEGTLLISMLANGDFREPLPQVTDARGRVPVPWWKSSRGAAQLVELEGGVALLTAPQEFASQAIAAHAPLVGGTRIRGKVSGLGLLTISGSLRSADGGVGGRAHAQLRVGTDGPLAQSFDFLVSDLLEHFGGRLPVPRLELELRADPAGTGCLWSELEVLVPWPAQTPAQLRAELEAELDWIIELWLEKAQDKIGPVHTAFMTTLFDVKTGAPLFTIDGGHNSFVDLLFDAMDEVPRDLWHTAFERGCEDILTVGIHPQTGLPRLWDATLDQPKDQQGVEIAPTLAFLLDLAKRGPSHLRERALSAALRMGETVLVTGQMPDGAVAAKYRPADGLPNTHLVQLRRLDIAAQLGRLAQRTGDERFLDAAREAAAAVEYTHYWPGGWSDVDPGFDDIYGHFGKRAVTLWREWPEEPIFKRIALGGFEHYEQPWIDACRLGGNVAADQVRCWDIVLEIGELEPALEPRIARCLAAAVRAHLQGQQYGNGAWGDVTIYGFDPQDHLQVGDLPGVPQNLLQGLAWATRLDLEAAGGPTAAELRAWFSAVLRSSQSAYKRPFGYLSTRFESAGANPARGSIGIASGIVAMLQHLGDLDEEEE